MTDQWRRAFERLKDAEAPLDRIRGRAAAGPSSAIELPRRRQRIAAGAVVAVVFAGAALFAWSAMRPSDTAPIGPAGSEAVVSFDIVPPDDDLGGGYPRAFMDVGSHHVEGTVTSFSWSEGDGYSNIDTVTPEFGARDYVALAPSTTLVIAGSADSVSGSIHAPGTFPFQELAPLDLSSGKASLPADPGRYVLRFIPEWEQGSPTFFFPIEIEATAADTEAPTTPDVVDVVCATDGTSVPPVARLTEAGLKFNVDIRSDVDEVLIDGVSGEATQHAADMDLSSATAHTFLLPPGDYMIGCFRDKEITDPEGGWASLPGMVPVEVIDPDGLYVSPNLTCAGEGAFTDLGFASSPSDSSPEGLIRAGLEGDLPTDLIEPTGYPVVGNMAYRVVRHGAVIATLGVHPYQGSAMLVLEACRGYGLDLAEVPRGSSSPTPSNST